MAMSLASLKTTAPERCPFTFIYGPEKVGKTSLGAEYPAPVLIQTPGENPSKDVQIDTFGQVENFTDFEDALESLFIESHSFQTLMIDSADGLQRLINDQACKENGWASIEEPGFGKGYVEAENIWAGRVITPLLELRKQKGMSIVITAHAEIFKFDSPTSESYSRYRPNLRKGICDLIQAKADIIAFLNHRVTIKKEDAGFKKTTTRGEGSGLRVIYLDERPGFIAGNRYSMPTEIIFKPGSGYSELAKYLPKAS